MQKGKKINHSVTLTTKQVHTSYLIHRGMLSFVHSLVCLCQRPKGRHFKVLIMFIATAVTSPKNILFVLGGTKLLIIEVLYSIKITDE